MGTQAEKTGTPDEIINELLSELGFKEPPSYPPNFPQALSVALGSLHDEKDDEVTLLGMFGVKAARISH